MDETTTDATSPANPDVTPITKASQTQRGKRATGTAKAPAKKAASKATKKATKALAKKAAGSTVVRSKSNISKDGTKKDEFTGEVLPVTQFPTVHQKDGSYVRGPVARKNLEAWRAKKKADRAKKAAASTAGKKAAGSAKKAS